MEFLGLYAIFALATAFTACIELMLPIMQYRKSLKHRVEYEFLHYLSFFGISLLSAPLILPSCIVPSWSIRFRAVLYTSIFPTDAKI